jgi:D-serine deaminase-like pyridoxal phosphate-dependent protein
VQAGRSVDVLVKVDVGFHRCGIRPEPASAVPFIQDIASLPGLHLRGLLSHAGQAYHAASEEELRRIAEDEARTLHALASAAREAGVQIDELSAGDTPTARYSLQQDWITEFRCGNYVYFDRTQVGLGAATIEECALTVLATVVTRHDDRVLLDCGSKTLSSDAARGFSPLPGHGTVLRDGRPDANLLIERLSEEHAVVRAHSGTTDLAPGDRVRVIPNHSCVVSNLVDQAWLTDGAAVLGPLPIAARGRIT